MPITINAGSATIGTSGWCISEDVAAGSAVGRTDSAVVQVMIDFDNLTAGDEYRVWIEGSAGNNVLTIYDTRVVGSQGSVVWVAPSLMLGEEWYVYVFKVTGTDRVIYWSLREVS